jgi:hypothetical protein
MMRIWTRLKLALAGGILLCLPLPAAYAYAEPLQEYAIKAAFIYNFATFTEWPTKNAETLQLCILGRDPFDTALSSIEGKQVGNARLTIRYAASSEHALRGCRIAFISASERDRLPLILGIAREAGMLTIADMEGAAREGVMIEMMLEQNKVTFQINLEAARHARLNISSKLLRLAKAVY